MIRNTVKAPCPQAGLSLLEVLIAVIILAIAGSALVITSRTAILGQHKSKIYGDAATATKEVLESIQLLGLDSVSALNNRVMSHSQGKDVVVRATARSLVAGDVSDISVLDTTTLRYITLTTRFVRFAGGDTATKTFSTIVYKP